MKKIIKAILNVFNIRKVGAIRHVLKRKNAQIRAEREKYQAEKAANSILVAYIFYLVSQCGVIRIPKAEVSAALGKYEACAYSDGGDYVIELKNAAEAGEGATCGKAGSIQPLV